MTFVGSDESGIGDPMVVEAAIRAAIHPGQILETPSRGKLFTVEAIDDKGIVLGLGQGAWRTRITWECLQGIVPFIREHGGDIAIGGRHDVEGNPGTLDEWLKSCVKRTTAGWVAGVLQRAGIVEVIHDRRLPVGASPVPT